MDRLDRLERSVTRWKWATMASLSVAVLAGAAQTLPAQLDLTQIRVVDEKGNQRIRLDPSWGGKGPGIVFYSTSGKPIATFVATDGREHFVISLPDHQTGRDLVRIDSMTRQGTVEVSNAKGRHATFVAPGSVPF